MPEEPTNVAEPSSLETSHSPVAVAESNSTTNPGLSTGILIGVSVVAALCALALTVLAVYLLRRWIKQRGTKKNNHYVGMPPAQYPGFQLERGYTQNQNDGLSHSTTETISSKRYIVAAHIPIPHRYR